MNSATAIIIGGGVIGLSTAYQLARKQFGRIILLEKDRVGAGSSSRTGGIITSLLWTETGVRARQISLTLYLELSDDLPGYHFRNVGCLNLFDAASWPEQEVLLPLYDRSLRRILRNLGRCRHTCTLARTGANRRHHWTT